MPEDNQRVSVVDDYDDEEEGIDYAFQEALDDLDVSCSFNILRCIRLYTKAY